MTDKTYNQLVKKMNEVSSLPPQTMGPFTPLYRSIIPYFKSSLWRPLAAGSLLLTIGIYLILGTTIVWIVSVLQHGF